MTQTPRILIIEDDAHGRQSVLEAVEDAGFSAVGLPDGTRGVEAFRGGRFDAVLTDLVLPDMDGLEVLDRLRRIDDAVPVVIMTAYGSVPTAVRALKSGAHDYLLKPLDLEALQSKLARAVETRRLRAEVSQLRSAVAERYSARAMVARSESMRGVLKRLESVAGTDATVLVTGESGTGKELVARALHSDGRRFAGPFVAVNCGAIAESLLEAELFGHEKGSFTGATAMRKGAFERAQGGTLFLDEIGIAPLSVQARLLRVLEEREIVRVGGQVGIPVDVRVVSASNRDLDELVTAGEFRHDLLFRLKVVTIALPPLRERREDIRPLAERFIAQSCEAHGRHIDSVDESFLAALEAQSWPGNARELRNVVESAVIMAAGATLTSADVRVEPARGAPASVLPVGLTLVDLERRAILEALQRNRGNRTITAAELGVSLRTIQRKIKDYDLPF